MFQNKMSIDRTVTIIFTVITNLPCRVPRALGVVESGVLDTIADNLKVNSSCPELVNGMMLLVLVIGAIHLQKVTAKRV
jgi:hypothetical protein